MADKAEDTTPKADAFAASDTLAQLQEAGFTNMMGMGTAWLETVNEMGAEVLSFVADRVKEDVKTQHRMMHCKNVSELQQIQAEFIQKAIDQYQAETGKLVEMSTKSLVRGAAKQAD